MNVLGQSGPFAKASRLIVTIAVADPSDLSAAGAVLDAYQTAQDAPTKANPDLATLTKDLDRDPEMHLKNPTFPHSAPQ